MGIAMVIYTYEMLQNEYPVTCKNVQDMVNSLIKEDSYAWLPNPIITNTFRRIVTLAVCEYMSEYNIELSTELVFKQAEVTANRIVLSAGYFLEHTSEHERTIIICSYLYGVTDMYNSIDEY